MSQTRKEGSWSPEELALVKQHYPHKQGTKILAELLPDREYNQIKAQANLMGLRRKPLYFKNENFFSTMTGQTAAVAGFIAADGYVNTKDMRLHLGLSDKDFEYLDDIKRITGYTGPIISRKPKEAKIIDKDTGKEYTIGKGRVCTLQVGKASKWISDLNQHWNIGTRKTFDLKPPSIDRLDLVLSYISGLIDGDGWICFTKDGVPSVHVMGTKEVMEWVKMVFNFLTPDHTRNKLSKTSSPNVYVYGVNGARAYVIWKIFMSLDIHRLNRKWDVMLPYHEAVINKTLCPNTRRDKVLATDIQPILDAIVSGSTIPPQSLPSP